MHHHRQHQERALNLSILTAFGPGEFALVKLDQVASLLLGDSRFDKDMQKEATHA